MPHFRFRAVEPQLVQPLSKTLIDDLESLMKSPREDFTFEYIYTTFYHEGEVSPAYPFVEVLWFDRGQEVKDQVAQIITEQVRDVFEAPVDVAVIFTALDPANYYDNAQHY
jgi:phenylpyruvate tautomerase PptA (4-oxalocrotonate tautomerase family)